MGNINCNRCVIIGGAPEDDISYISSEIEKQDFIICADGGFDKCVKLNIKPNMIVGDMDSIGFSDFGGVDIIRLPREKDQTDTFACLYEGLKLGFDNFLILGCLGGRLDHIIANLGVLLYSAERELKAVLADKNTKVFMVKEDTLRIKGYKGQIVSVFSYGSEYCLVSYEGLKYPMKKEKIYGSTPFGISNELTCKNATITVHEGCVVVILLNDF